MSPAAQRAQFDFVRLAAEEPSSLYFEQFLRDGFAAWPSSYQSQFPGLSTWQGIAGLKRSLRTLAGAPDDWKVLLASQSLSLAWLATRSMFRVCGNVMTTDLSWPTYQHAIEQRARRAAARVTVIPLRDQILDHRWTTRDVADYLATAFAKAECDGLFLPAVDHLGVRLPIREIVAAVQRRRSINFCFVDAAQAFCQVPIDDCFEWADFIVAGSHKWLGAYLPMGIGWIKPKWSRSTVREGEVDSLLRFIQHLDRDELHRHSETVNVLPLLTCSGAAQDRLLDGAWRGPPDDAYVRQWGLADWLPVRPAPELRSQIVLLENRNGTARRQSVDAVRQIWLNHGRVITAYPGGHIRISAPRNDERHYTQSVELNRSWDWNAFRQSDRGSIPSPLA
ncbi:MAG: aminotransferase class V-fold PLP-dependent enzyme [Planctomycetaceae bacterium]|nr:aminotransferase class V-fold PLP-dependent enzyme [Planctomycetaceae bacterium]